MPTKSLFEQEEKSVRANDPIQIKKMKGAFSLNNPLVGSVRPPEGISFLAVFFLRGFPFFCVFSFFSSDFMGSVGISILVYFWVGFSLPFPRKKQGRTGSGKGHLKP